jgi:hypothetical protein
VIEAAALLTLVQLAVRLLPAARVSRLLGSVTSPVATDAPVATEPSDTTGGSGPRPDLRRAKVVGRAVATAARRLPWHPTCLPRAITAAVLLRRRGIECQTHLGIVRRTPFLAHAWATVDGVVVQGGDTTGITELAAFTGLATGSGGPPVTA